MAALVGIGILGIGIAAVEILLREFLPYSLVTIGHLYADNADLYGWGFHPYELIRTRDPDTGEIYKAYANNHGWRDRDRVFENPSGAYRILALGDSHTFGPLVPATHTYTRILEDTLTSAGYDVEVLNIAYGQWGTDQEVEALRLEGARYQPDLIVLQFCDNDLLDNTYRQWHENKALKPFYYDLSDDGHLVRHANPDWTFKESSLKDRLRRLITTSEILKRCYGVYLRYALRSLGPTAWTWQLAPEAPASIVYSYSVDSTKIEHLNVVLQGRLGEFSRLLRSLEGNTLSANGLDELLWSAGVTSQRDTIFRILEDHWFPRGAKDSYWLTPPDSSCFEWRLYFALLEKGKAVADSLGADLAVISDQELGLYLWRRYWHIIAPGDQHLQAFLGYSELIRRFSEARDIGFIASHHQHTRARNDPHPNLEGNRAMALNVFEYLLKHHTGELDQHRRSVP
ncbi:SGNH/GDSL hydrolase family protein [Candidatus Fermentibacteria bacterium]|nr:SGNH/GDSL hydrolase family protein [Candidatus Fermentibacteria bacterium]